MTISYIMSLQYLMGPGLAELEARRQLKESQSVEDVVTRRVYMSKLERDCTAQLPEIVLKKYFKAGEFVHVPMTREERSLIDQFQKFNKRKQTEPNEEEDLMFLTAMLPGRRCEDVQNFLKDLSSNSISDAILVFTGEALDSNPLRIPTEKQNIRPDWPKYLERQFSIFESSGSITQIACRTGFQNARVMIGACATQEERYNRIGELLMAYREPESNEKDSIGGKNDNYEVLILDGHKKVKSTPNGQVAMRQTVTCATYDPLTDYFFSGGYDGDVVAWSASKAISVDTVGSHPKPINSIACHSTKNIVAYGCQNGSVFYAKSSAGKEKQNFKPYALFVKPKAKESFSNTVDHVAMPSMGERDNSCYAGIGFLQSSNAGVVEEWDLEKGVFVSASEGLSNGLTCMSLSSCGTMLATGTGGIASDEVKGDGIVRVMDLNQNLKTVIAIPTKKYDLDCVSFSPNSQLLFMGETSDSSIAVYDLRYPSEPLFVTSHGTAAEDAVVGHAWLSNGNILATGGHDGLVKLWDCQRGFSLLNAFEFNSSISCITYSEADHSLWVGADNGGVYMLASPGSLGENHPKVISGKCVF